MKILIEETKKKTVNVVKPKTYAQCNMSFNGGTIDLEIHNFTTKTKYFKFTRK